MNDDYINTLAKQTTRHIPSLTGRSYGRKIFLPTNISSLTGRLYGRKILLPTNILSLTGRLYGRKIILPTNISSLTGRSYGRKIFRPYQHFVPDGTINATTLSRQGQNVGRKPYQTQITVPSGTECKGMYYLFLYNALESIMTQKP
jgi:hypothetical protein